MLEHFFHMLGVDPFVLLKGFIIPKTELKSRIHGAPSIDVIVRALTHVPDPNNVNLFRYHRRLTKNSATS
jgi:hypothetical protein